MDAKNLISCLAGLGLILIDTSCEKQELNPLGENLKFQKSNQSGDFEYTPLYQVEIPAEIQDQMIALLTLSNDVFNKPHIAEEFSKDPEAYLKSIGLPSCKLDLNSVEVKAVLALGDDEIRESIINRDLEKYVSLLHEKNYLNWKTSHYNDIYQNFLEGALSGAPELAQMGLNVFPSSFLICFPFVPWVAAPLVGPDYPIAVIYPFLEANLITNPVIKIFGLESNNPGSDTYVINEIVDQQVDQIIKAMRTIASYQDKEIEASDEVLKSYLRKPLTQHLIDFGLI